MAHFKTPDYSIAYTTIDQAWSHDLVFLNGNLATNRWWIPTVEHLHSMAPGPQKKGRLILIELPGCGDSAPLEKDLNTVEIANQYLELLKSLNVEKTSIIGHSTGGLIAAMMMSKKPEMFDRALLLDPVGPQGITFENSVLEKYEEMKTNRTMTAMIIGFTINNCDMGSAFFNDVIVTDTQKAVQNVGARMILALRDKTFEAELTNFKTPTTVLFGEKDVLLPKAHAQALASMNPNGKFVVVPGIGHCMNIENPRLMAEFIKNELY
jgi:pimeloyl-ACP methyl ester carboxylesterase